jgi:hypothetical protein
MKNKISKRVLSVFLAVLMVITTMPVFAITASAGENQGFVQAYLTSNVTDGISENYNVTWDSDENAAYFSGNSAYLVLEGTPLSTVTAESGFAISFDYKRDTSNGDNGRIFDFNDGTVNNSFAVNGGLTSGNNVYRKLETLAKVNGSQNEYFTSDFNNSTYCDYTGSNFSSEESPDTWYSVTVTMSPSGLYSYYIILGIVLL